MFSCIWIKNDLSGPKSSAFFKKQNKTLHHIKLLFHQLPIVNIQTAAREIRSKRQLRLKSKSTTNTRGFSHVICSPPAPPPAPGQHFWSPHPPAALPHQTHYPSKPGSGPAAYHSLCALVSAEQIQQVREEEL